MKCCSLRSAHLTQRMFRRFPSIYFILLLSVLLTVTFYLIHDSNEVTCQRIPSDSTNNQSLDKGLIFIGGMPRSGTTLMRAILDSHPSIRCGEETRILPRILSMRTSWEKSTVEWNRLIAGGMSKSILDAGMRAFIYEILSRHSQYADVLCDKDPFVLKYTSYISSIFPHAKFLLIIRDARAVIHSVMTRKVTITGFSATDYRQNFRLWNNGVQIMYEQCVQVGQEKCLLVYYEQLVLQPKKTMEHILNFLNLPWTDSVLRHEELIGTKISLSKSEHSSDQVVKPINLEALTRWMGHIPADIHAEIEVLAPMMVKLGYDVHSDEPTYGAADAIVLEKMNQLKTNAEYWEAKVKLYARQLSNITTTPSIGFIV